jgi:protein-S-isoprenylcysteine O-methyltransferase Ste14
MFRLFAFLALAAALAYVSRAPLKSPRSHGFYRYFAWTFILALFFLNFQSLEQWFGSPLSVRQLASWFLLVGSIVPGVLGIQSLRTLGKPDAQRNDAGGLIGIEKTTRLVKSGAYKYIRHPMYSSLLFVGWGVFFKDPSWIGGGVALGATAFLVATAKAEESENLLYFGSIYRAYMRRTKMFIPFLF